MLVIFLVALLTGCTAAGDRLSGSSLDRDPAIAYPTTLDQIQIGRTTKDEVRSLLGTPTDIQLSSRHETGQESWAYAKASPASSPLQYVPGFGLLALSKQQRQSSFSISFSADGIVDGIVLREVQPFGDSGASRAVLGTTREVSPYGINNPLTHHTRQGASFGSGIIEE